MRRRFGDAFGAWFERRTVGIVRLVLTFVALGLLLRLVVPS